MSSYLEKKSKIALHNWDRKFFKYFSRKKVIKDFFSCVREESYLNTYPVRFFDKKKSEYKIKKKSFSYQNEINEGKLLKLFSNKCLTLTNIRCYM